MFAVMLVAGCASTPQYRYYTIDMQPGAKIESAVQLVAVRLDVNQALQRPEILIRTSPTQVEYYALDRWASDLQEQVTEKLRTEFGTSVSGAKRLNLVGTLMSFEQVDAPTGAEVQVKLEVIVDSLTFQKIYQRREPAAAATAPAVVEALSRATEAIASELAADLAQVVANADKN
jgi:uncharacterized lipoprotein YmbA